MWEMDRVPRTGAEMCKAGKAVEDGPKLWDPASMWETWKKLLAPGFRSVQHQPLWPRRE